MDTRTCETCRWKFRPLERGQRFCSLTCERIATLAATYHELARFAQEHLLAPRA